MGFFIAQLLTGLASASSLFLVAAGLSIIFGVTRIVNFAHGSFFMLGAYLAYTIVGLLPAGILGFWGAVLLAALIVGLLGAAIEFLILSRLYGAPQLFQLVATFALVLIIQDAALTIWGAEDLIGPRAPGLDGAVRILGETIPEYDLALIVIGPAVLLAAWLLFYRTRWGVLVRAATEDREMLAALGVDQRRLFTSVFFVGSFLAGLGGALQLPREAVSLLMDLNVIAEAFVVVVIGGMGSVLGAFLAAVAIGELNAFGVLLLPEITLVLPFLVMAAVLIARPWGLLGRAERLAHEPLQAEEPLRLPGKGLRLALIAGLVLLTLLPLAASSFTLVLLTDLLLAALFAASLHFMMGLGGMASFGHAAYFGLGAYGAALLATSAGLGMLPALVGGPLVAGLGALIFGWFCVRLSGVYLAMLTLAAAQIVWSVVFQWREVTGGDDGILGVWPAPWAASREAVYYLALLASAGGIALLWRFAHAPFGYLLRAGRDSPLRAEAIGLDLRRQQWAAFVAAGTFAGVAGAVFAFSKGSIFPDELAIPRSVDALIMVLLGGLHSLFGPLLGSAAFVLLEDFISRLDYWRALLGLVILVIVIAAPDGLAGGLRRLWRAAAGRAA
jgi:branched-chain amino acid transport system permease protein